MKDVEDDINEGCGVLLFILGMLIISVSIGGWLGAGVCLATLGLLSVFFANLKKP